MKDPQAASNAALNASDQRLVDQIAVPQDTNEEAAVAAHLPKMDLAGVCVTADAAHTTKANCRQVTVELLDLALGPAQCEELVDRSRIGSDGTRRSRADDEHDEHRQDQRRARHR